MKPPSTVEARVAEELRNWLSSELEQLDASNTNQFAHHVVTILLHEDLDIEDEPLTTGDDFLRDIYSIRRGKTRDKQKKAAVQFLRSAVCCNDPGEAEIQGVVDELMVKIEETKIKLNSKSSPKRMSVGVRNSFNQSRVKTDSNDTERLYNEAFPSLLSSNSTNSNLVGHRLGPTGTENTWDIARSRQPVESIHRAYTFDCQEEAHACNTARRVVASALAETSLPSFETTEILSSEWMNSSVWDSINNAYSCWSMQSAFRTCTLLKKFIPSLLPLTSFDQSSTRSRYLREFSPIVIPVINQSDLQFVHLHPSYEKTLTEHPQLFRPIKDRSDCPATPQSETDIEVDRIVRARQHKQGKKVHCKNQTSAVSKACDNVSRHQTSALSNACNSVSRHKTSALSKAYDSVSRHQTSEVSKSCDSISRHKPSALSKACDSVSRYQTSALSKAYDSVSRHQTSKVSKSCDSVSRHHTTEVSKSCDSVGRHQTSALTKACDSVGRHQTSALSKAYDGVSRNTDLSSASFVPPHSREYTLKDEATISSSVLHMFKGRDDKINERIDIVQGERCVELATQNDSFRTCSQENNRTVKFLPKHLWEASNNCETWNSEIGEVCSFPDHFGGFWKLLADSGSMALYPVVTNNLVVDLEDTFETYHPVRDKSPCTSYQSLSVRDLGFESRCENSAYDSREYQKTSMEHYLHYSMPDVASEQWVLESACIQVQYYYCVQQISRIQQEHNSCLQRASLHNLFVPSLLSSYLSQEGSQFLQRAFVNTYFSNLLKEPVNLTQERVSGIRCSDLEHRWLSTDILPVNGLEQAKLEVVPGCACSSWLENKQAKLEVVPGCTCSSWLENNCHLGDSCPFSHPSL